MAPLERAGTGAVTPVVRRDAGAREPKSPGMAVAPSSDQAGPVRISPAPGLEAPPEAQAAEANSSTPPPRPWAGRRGRAHPRVAPSGLCPCWRQQLSCVGDSAGAEWRAEHLLRTHEDTSVGHGKRAQAALGYKVGRDSQATSVVQSSGKEMSRNEHEEKWGKREASVETNVQGESRS